MYSITKLVSLLLTQRSEIYDVGAGVERVESYSLTCFLNRSALRWAVFHGVFSSVRELRAQLDSNDVSSVDEITDAASIAQRNGGARLGYRSLQVMLVVLADVQTRTVGKMHDDLASQRIVSSLVRH